MKWSRAITVTGCLLGAFYVSPAAHATDQSLSWSTYLRTGPGMNYAVVDELQHDTVVDVRDCGARWCAVVSGRGQGYIDRDALSLPKPPPGTAPIGGPQGCFWAGQYSYRSPEPTQFCQTQPPK